MPYIVKVDGKDFKVDMEWSGGTYHITLDGRSLEAEVIMHENRQATLVIGNQSYIIAIDNDSHILINGEDYCVQVLDEILSKLLKAGAVSVQKKEVTIFAPMPGLVIDIEVKEGDPVKNGQGLVIVEAMKMQNEMKSPRDGIVKKVLVQTGQTVNGKDALVIIE